MTPDSKPDVEALIAEIREQVDRAEAAVLPPPEASGGSTFGHELQEANRQAEAARDTRGLHERLLRRVLRFLIRDINAFQAASVRCLNHLAILHQARGDEGAADALDAARKSLDRQAELEKRVHVLEEEVRTLKESR